MNDSEEKEKNGRNLPPELIRNVRRYIQQRYLPETGPAGMNASVPDASRLESRPRGPERPEKRDGSLMPWKYADGDEEEFLPAERIELLDGKPVLSDARDMRQNALQDLEEEVLHTGETFHQMLFRLIREKGFSEAEVYRRANIDRKLFSKIRCNPGYVPHKRNVIALALALRLSPDETDKLLQSAELALSPGSRADLIVEYCIRSRIYDLDIVNELLDEFGQPVLG